MQVITTHLNADFDCLASMLAAKKLYPDARIVFPGSQEKNVRDFLKYSDISFTFDKLKGFPLDNIDHLIMVDTGQPERIGVFQKILNKPGLQIDVYDHHPFLGNDIKADKIVVMERGATITILVEIMKEKGTDISPDEATVMALGIYEDTASLTATSTTGEDLRAVEFLLSKGANLSTVSDFLSREMSTDQVWLLNELLRSLDSHKVNGIDVALATASTDNYINDLALLTHKVKDIKNLNLLITIVRMGDRIHMVGRSRLEAVDVAEILSEFGGGGHPTASSASVREMTLIQAKNKLLKILAEKIQATDEIREIMSSPAKYINPDSSMSDAMKLLRVLGFNTLPVVENEKVTGIITRQVIGKALHHQMEDEKVHALMSTDFSVVYADTSSQELIGILLEKKQALVPVIQRDSGKLAGVATRTDLLQKLYGDSLEKPALLRKGEGGRFPYSKSVKGLMRERLPAKIVGLFKTAGEISDRLGYNVFVVGGFVRDLLLRIGNFDVDLVVEGDGIEFARHLGESLKARVHTHERFGTAVVVLPDNFKIDVTTARMESYEHPAALPVVEQGSIRNDLYRRDFTINALAVKLNGKKAFRLLDFFGGQKDLKEKAIRILHNLSFVEDPTRAFRAIRFEQRFNFDIGKQTLTLLKNAVNKKLLDRLSGDRVLSELALMFREKEPQRMIKRMASLGLFQFIHPSMKINEEKLVFFKKINDAVVWYELLYTEKPVKNWLVYIMGLLKNLNPEQTAEACNKLGIHGNDLKIMMDSKKHILEASKLLVTAKNPSATELYRTLHPLEPEVLLLLMASMEKEGAKKHLSYFITHLREVHTELSGKDLINMGLAPGPLFKEVMDALLYARLEGKIKSREDETKFVKERYLQTVEA